MEELMRVSSWPLDVVKVMLAIMTMALAKVVKAVLTVEVAKVATEEGEEGGIEVLEAALLTIMFEERE